MALQIEKIVLSDGHFLVTEPGWEFRLMVAIPMGVIPLAGYTVFYLISTKKAGLVLTSATLLRDLIQHSNKSYEFTWLRFL